MISSLQKTHSTLTHKIISSCIAFTFLFTMILPPGIASAQTVQTILNLPAPGAMVPLTAAYVPCIIQGVSVYYDNPFQFDFILDTGNAKLNSPDQVKEESRKLIKYFLAALTVPENDLWVNLSPYEKDKIITENFSQTEMGRDMLAQDYLLKQLSSSLIYPEEALGKEFWQKAYKKAQEKYGTTEIPLNTFNKVWIIPETAVVFEHGLEPTKANPSYGRTAFVVESKLKVMMDEDYVAMTGNLGNKDLGTSGLKEDNVKEISQLTSEIYREIILPEIEKEVNQGQNFASLRQIFNSLILATWYKQNLKESILGQVYADKNKVAGVDVQDKEAKRKIYNQYLEALKTGVFNYIKEDFDEYAKEPMPRKYFAGGVQARFDISNLRTVTDLGQLTPQQAKTFRALGEKFRERVQLMAKSAEKVESWHQDVWDAFLSLAWEQQVPWIREVKIDPRQIYGPVDGFLTKMEQANVAGINELSREFEILKNQGKNRFLEIPEEYRASLAEAMGLAPGELEKVIPRGHASDRGIILLRHDAGSLLHELLAYVGRTHPESVAWEMVFEEYMKHPRWTANTILEQGLSEQADKVFSGQLEQEGFKMFSTLRDIFILSGEDIGHEMAEGRPQELLKNLPAKVRDLWKVQEKVTAELTARAKEAYAATPEVLADIARGDVYNDEQIEALNLMAEIGQTAVVREVYESPKGFGREVKQALLDQIVLRNRTYPGGLKAYTKKSEKLFALNAKGVTPYTDVKAIRPKQPYLVGTVEGREFQQLTQEGLEVVKDVVFAMPAGGLGERLGYSGIKLGLPLDLATMKNYLEEDISNILALQSKSGARGGIPLVLMTSQSTHQATLDLLEKNNYFGMAGLSVIDGARETVVFDKGQLFIVDEEAYLKDGTLKNKRQLKQVVLFQQHDVFAMNAMTNQFYLDQETGKISEKPHNHGDIHLLMHLSGLAKAYKDAGKKYTLFFQDTNGETFNAVLPGLGATKREGYKANLLAVERKEGDPIGGVAIFDREIEQADGRVIKRTEIGNIEYNEIETVVKGSGFRETDFKAGNINIYVLDQERYTEVLARPDVQGTVREIVNPKIDKKTGQKVGRLEAMMQDITKEMDHREVGVTMFPARYIIAATKNDLRGGLLLASEGNFPEHMAAAEGVHALNNRLKFHLAGVRGFSVEGETRYAYQGRYKVEVDLEGRKRIEGLTGEEAVPFGHLVENKSRFVEGIPYQEGARISFTPGWAVTLDEIKAKLTGGEGEMNISPRSHLVIEGNNIIFGKFDIDGALVVKARSDQTLKIDGLVASNAGWRIEPLKLKYLKDKSIPEYVRLRGYQLKKEGQMVIDITRFAAGNYRVGADGVIRMVSETGERLAVIAEDKTILKWQTPEVQKSGKKDSLEVTLNKIIKEYDIRGFDGGDNENFPAQMDEELGTWLGRGLGSLEFFSDRHGRSVGLQPGDLFVIAGDNGPRTPSVRRWFTEGLRDTGVHVLDLGAVGAGVLFSAISRLGAKGGLYVTRSHVEVGTNGAKPNIGGITLYGDMLMSLKGMIMSGQYRKAEKRGEAYNESDARAKEAIDKYFAELKENYGHIKQMLVENPIPITVNMSGGSLTENKKYQSFFKEIFGEGTDFLRAEPDQWGKQGTADPTRPDALGKIMDYSKEHPEKLIFNFDLDADRITILWGGNLYLGDTMFYPVLEYMLTIDKAHASLDQKVHKGLNRTYFYDSRMSSEVAQIIEHFGGIAKIHPKGHSKVKATMDQMLDQLAENEGYTGKDRVKQFVAAHPGFKLIQAEYSTHMFTTNKNGEAFDDAVLFMFAWLDMFAQVKKKHAQEGGASWTLADYIQFLREKEGIKADHQLAEQRMPVAEGAKFKVMWEMTNQLDQFMKQREGFAYAPKWDWKGELPSATSLLQNVEGVFDLTTPLGGMFWGWSNTSPKIALGARATSPDARKAMATMVGALYIHARNKVAREMGLELEMINPRETDKFFALFGLSNQVYVAAKIAKDTWDNLSKAEKEKLEKEWYPKMSAELEQRILKEYPTMESVLQAIAEARAGTQQQQQAEEVGGINLNPALFTLDVRRDEKGAPLPLPQQPIYNMQFDGFIPVIIDIIPIQNLNMLLGGKLDIPLDDKLSKRE